MIWRQQHLGIAGIFEQKFVALHCIETVLESLDHGVECRGPRAVSHRGYASAASFKGSESLAEPFTNHAEIAEEGFDLLLRVVKP
jgi:hypothetical protein